MVVVLEDQLGVKQRKGWRVSKEAALRWVWSTVFLRLRELAKASNEFCTIKLWDLQSTTVTPVTSS